MVIPLSGDDEELHPVGREKHWQESFYFNWVDNATGSFGLARIGYRLPSGRGDALVVTTHGAKRELVYAAINQKTGVDRLTTRAETGFEIGRLTFRMEEPLRRWRIELQGPDTLDLTWTALSNPFDFADSGGAQVLAARHFEQPGIVSGSTTIGGRQRTITGFGTRDKSWGPRDWGTITGWEWISAQFDGRFAFTVMQSGPPGRREQSGFVYHDGMCTAVESFDLEHAWRRPHGVARTALIIRDALGRSYSVTGQARAHVPLFKSGMLLEEVPADFEAIIGDEPVSGSGVIEHTWHAGKLETLRWLPELAPVLVDAMKSSRP